MPLIKCSERGNKTSDIRPSIDRQQDEYSNEAWDVFQEKLVNNEKNMSNPNKQSHGEKVYYMNNPLTVEDGIKFGFGFGMGIFLCGFALFVAVSLTVYFALGPLFDFLKGLI
jgi:hypothetical protein